MDKYVNTTLAWSESELEWVLDIWVNDEELGRTEWFKESAPTIEEVLTRAHQIIATELID